MAVTRSHESLERNRRDVLDAWRSQHDARPEAGMLPRHGVMRAGVTYGRVASVVTEDAFYGPHLMVRRQRWSGIPPTPSDAPGEAVRCYPGPGHVVTDYAEDDFVRIAWTQGAVVAELPA